MTRPRPPRATRTRFAAGLVGLFVCATMTWLLAWAGATSLYHGAAPVLVASGSMGPTIRAGDLVILEPYHSQELDEGDVIRFRDPTGPGTVLHRITRIDPDGTIRTKGDANDVIDSTAVDTDTITGVGSILVPRSGLPVLWWRTGDWIALGLFAAIGLSALWVCRYALSEAHDPWRHPQPAARPRPPLPVAARQAIDDLRDDIAAHGPVDLTRRLVLRRGAELAGLGVATAFLASSRTAWAAYTDTTDNPANSFGAATLAPPTSLTLTPSGCSGSSTIVPTSSTTAADTGTGAAITVPRPLGAQVGDLLVAQVAFHTHSFVGTITAPAGWTTVRVDNDANHEIQGVFWKVATASEPTSYTFTNTTADTGREGSGAITAYKGVDTTNPIDAHGATTYPSGGSSITAPSLTATVAGTRLLVLVGQRANGPVTPPTGMTERYEINAGAQNLVTMADQAIAGAGATGTRTATSADNGSSVAQAVLLRPKQITVVGSAGTAGAPNGAAGSITLPTPSGTAAGDVLLAHVVVHGHSFGGGTITPPAGWTTVRVDNEGAHLTAAVFRRLTSAGEPASHTFTNATGDTSQQAVGAILAYRGVDPVSPVAAHAAAVSVTNTADAVIAPSVTPTRAGSRLVAFAGTYGPGSQNHGPATPPPTMGERYDRSEVNENGQIEVLGTAADQVLATSDPTGTRTFTIPRHGTSVAQTLVLAPAVNDPYADLSWSPSTSPDIDGYVVERWVGGTLQASHTVGPDTTSLVDGPLVAGTTYTYRIVATAGTWRSTPATTTFTPSAC